MLRTLITILVFFVPFGALALPQAALEHARSALLFAGRKDWPNAYEHAKATSDSALISLYEWQYLLDADLVASFDEYRTFITQHPDWPEQKKLRIRAEQALRLGTVPDQEIIDWFASSYYKDGPITGVGKIELAEAMRRKQIGSPEKINALIHDGWRSGDFDEPYEQQLLDRYRNILTKEDHIARVDRLVWEDKQGAAKRIIKLVPDNYGRLFKARMALAANKKLAVVAVAEVPSSLKRDPGLIFERIRYRARNDDDKGVQELLLTAPANVPYPEKWWKYRDAEVRTAIDNKEYALAKRLLASHGQLDGIELSEAMWLQGWLDTEFTHQPKNAVPIFSDMYDKVRYPMSKARAAFWTGRALEKSGDAAGASAWYGRAASYPTVYYGQLAAQKLGMNSLKLPQERGASSEARQAFNNSDLGKAIKLAIELDEKELASRMVTWLAENTKDEDQLVLLAELGKKNDYRFLGVRASKKAMQKNIVLIESGYPLIKTPAGIPLERALALAITRQESEFDPNALSPAGAIGMMQLMPRTAREIARKNDVPYARDRLREIQYNMQLGSLYLARLINSYDGSYVMGIAAYNAGPGNVRKWVNNFGTPGNNPDNAMNWIEQIPFSETRNYVQRVLSNLQVFREIDANGTVRLAIAEDLAR